MYPAQPVRTLEYVANRAKARFGRTTTELEDQLILDLGQDLRGICAEFPYWFLSMEPSSVESFPGTLTDDDLERASIHGTWLDQGWFYTKPGRPEYEVWAPAMFLPGHGASNWAPVELAQTLYVKQFDLSGSFVQSLPVTNLDMQLSGANFSSRGQPRNVVSFTRGHRTYLRFDPCPDEAYLFAVGGQLALPPWFSVGGSWTNLILAYYPRVMDTLAMMYYAEYFGEWEQRKAYRQILYGDSHGKFMTGTDHGLIGMMKADTLKRNEEAQPELEWADSSRAMLGRGGKYKREPGAAYYADPGTF